MEEIIVGNMRLENVHWRESMGKRYAFVVAEDMGRSGKGFKKPHLKNYWGEVKDVPDSECLKKVMLNGAKWDKLP